MQKEQTIQRSQEQANLIDQKSQIPKSNARYVYAVCIGLNDKKIDFGKGVEESKVYALPFEDICVIVHNCSAKAYETKDNSKAKQWIIQHDNIISKALEELGSIVPFRFDTIFKEEAQLIEFLKLNKEKFKERLKQLEGKREFGIKIFYKESLRERIVKEKTKQLDAIKKEDKGKSYFLRKRVEKEIFNELQDKLKKHFQEFYKKISIFGEIIAENIKEKNMLANFSCLVPTNKTEELGKSLGEINKLEDFSVRFTGPWPPYSFAQLQDKEQKNVA